MRRAVKNKYLNLQKDEIALIQKENKKPTLLMHTCCAVCACWPIVYLTQYFDLTLYYNNDNIYPFDEYQRRFDELTKYVNDYNLTNNQSVKIIKTVYQGEKYLKHLEPLKDEPEKGKRCLLCYTLRMEQAYQYANDNHFDYFTTVMSISRQKDSKVLNEIGEKLSTKYKTKYFYSDFKKEGGLEKGNHIAFENNMYRQNYCGCLYSYNEMLERTKQKGS